MAVATPNSQRSWVWRRIAHGSFYGRDIVSVKQFSRDDLDYIFRRRRRDAQHRPARGRHRPAQGPYPGQPVLRAEHAHLLVVHRRHAAPGRLGDPHPRRAVLVGEQGRIAARHHPHAGVLRRRDRPAPPGGGRLGGGGALCQQADHQRGRRRRRAPHAGAARHLHHPLRAGRAGRPARGHGGRPEERPHGALAGAPAAPVRHALYLCLARDPAPARRDTGTSCSRGRARCAETDTRGGRHRRRPTCSM